MNIFLLINKAMGYMDEATGGEGAGGSGTPAPAAAPATAAPAPAPVETPADTTAEVNKPSPLEAMGYAPMAEYWADKPALGMAIEFVAKAGLSWEDPAVQAADMEGDFTMLRAKLAAMDVPGYEAMLAIMEKESADAIAARQAAQDESTAQVKAILGEGFEDTWEWARGAFNEEETAAFNNMFSEGGQSALIAAIAMKTIYEHNSGATIPAQSATADLAPAQRGPAAAMTRQEFTNQTNALAAKYGNDFRNTAEYQALSRQRESARQRGL